MQNMYALQSEYGVLTLTVSDARAVRLHIADGYSCLSISETALRIAAANFVAL